MKKLLNKLALVGFISTFSFLSVQGQSPTKGFIYSPSTGVGPAVLDPNGDGYTSATASGFIANDISESEIPFVSVLPLYSEPNGDNFRGPGCGFTDLVEYSGTGVFSYLSPGNDLMFRFRLGNSITGSKAYAILIDTDGKIGNVGANADPNYIGGIKGNPGFEVEIVLETNFRVALYDVDGLTSGVLKTSLPVGQYSQQSVAYSTACGDADYFYDFFMPFSVITTYFPGLTPATPVRFLGVTVLAPQEALSGPASDTYGVPDNGNWNQGWTDIINAQPPTCFACTSGGYLPCTDAPVLNSPIAVGATSVSGTSGEVNGTTIRIYKNGALIGTTTVTGGTWTLSGISPALANNDSLTSKAQAVGKAACLFSNRVIIIAGCSMPPTISCLTRKGAQGSGPAGAPIGTVIKGYEMTSTGAVLVFTVSTVSGNTWLFDCSGSSSGCVGGVNCLSNASYIATATSPGQCESAASAAFDLSCGTPSTTPTVTTNPVYDYTTTISGTSTTATGTVYMFVNGTLFSSVAISASNWSFSSLSLRTGDTLTFTKVDGTNCMSSPATRIVKCKTATATLDGPIVIGATSVSGTSNEAVGSTITVYKNGVSIGTTTVLVNGTWTKSGIVALTTGDNIYVTQTSSVCDVSAASPTATVVASTPPPVITGTYYEQGTSVSGTSTAVAGTVIRVYIDGLLIGTTTVVSGGTWTLTGLSSTDLYAGGVLSATAQATGLGVSVLSNLVTVNCILPLSNLSLTSLTPIICSGDSASVRISSTQNLVIYTIVNQATSTSLSVSRLGNGSNIAVLTFPLSSSQWIKVKAEKIGGPTCSTILNDSLYITVSSYPDNTLTNTGPSAVCSGSTATISVSSSQLNTQYQLRDSTTNANVGSPVAGTGGTINLVTSALTTATTFYVWATNTSTSAFCSRELNGYIRVTVNALIVSNAGPDQFICNVTSATFAGNNPSPGTGTWSLVSGPNSPTITTPTSPTSTVTGLVPGVYTFRWTIVNGACTDYSQMQITIYASPTVSNAGPNQSLCNVTTTNLAGNAPTNGTAVWTQVSGPNTATITFASSPGTSISNLITGTYVFRWTISNGNCTSSFSDVQIIIYALPTVSNAGSNQNLCNVISTTLAGNSPSVGTGAWSLISGPNSPTITTPSSPSSTVTGMIAGTYIFQWSVSNGSCTSSTSNVQIIIYALPTTASAGSNQSLCNVTSTTMAANTPTTGTGAWSLVSGPNSPAITTTSSPTTTITGMVVGTYIFRWTITNGVCSTSTSDVQVSIYSIPTTANAGADQNLCNVTSATLSGNTPASGSGLWTLVSGPNTPTITSPASAITSVNGMITGIYTFRWSISNGACADTTDDIDITIYAIPTTAVAGANQNLCNVTSVTMAGNTSTVGTGNWSVVSGPNSPSITTASSPTTTITGLIAGVYIFRWTISNGVCATSSNTTQVTVYELPTTSNAGPNQNLCNVTSISLAGNSPASGTGLWSLLSGPNSPTITTPSSTGSTVTGMISGTYLFRWTISNGPCTNSTSDVTITIYPTPTTSNAGPDQNLCNVTSVTLAGNVAASGSGTWTTVSGPNAPTITSPSSNSSSVTGMITGTYVFRWSISSGVCLTSSDDVQIIIYAIPTASNAGSDQNLCNVTSTTLNGNIPFDGSGAWTFVSGPSVPTITTPVSASSTVTGMVSGTYFLRWTISNGVCSSSEDDVMIRIYSLPTTSNAGADQSLCNETLANLSGNVPSIGTGVWTFVSGPNTPVFADSSIASTQVNSLITGTYILRWNISNGVCAVSSDDVQIVNFGTPTIVNAGPDQDVCNSSSSSLAGNTPASGTGTWTVISGPNTPSFSSVNDPSATISLLIAGTYVLGWTIVNGSCTTSTDSMQINVYDLPTGSNAGPDQFLCSTSTITLAANNPTTGIGSWSLLSGPNTPLITDPSLRNTTVTAATIGVYVFRWIISNGNCTASTNDVQIDISSVPLFIDGGPDQEICDASSASLAANTPAIGTGVWDLIDGPTVATFSNVNDPNATLNGLSIGTYHISWTINNGVCSSPTDTVAIVNYALPSSADAGSDMSLCNDSMASLAAVVPASGTGVWSYISGPAGSVFGDSSVYNTTVSNLSNGVYDFVWTITNGVCAVNSDTVRITNLAVPSFANAGTDQELCNDTTTTLAGNNAGAATGNWRFISGPNTPTIVDSTNENTIVNGLIPGVYIFEWSISNSVCASTADSVQVNIYALPSTANAGTDVNLCNVVASGLSATPASTGIGNWTFVSGPNTPNIADSTFFNTGVSNLIIGVYEFIWTISNGVCAVSSDTVRLTNLSISLVADAGSDQDLCTDSIITMAANNAAAASGVWALMSGPNTPSITDITDENTTVTGLIAGIYVFSWTISNGVCSPTTDEVQITISAIPTSADAGSDQNLCNVFSTNMAAVSLVVGNGLWRQESGPSLAIIDSVNSASTAISGLVPGTYSFTWTVSSGICTKMTDTVNVSIDGAPTVADAGSDQAMCNVNSITLSGNIPLSGFGTWSQVSGPNAPALTSPSSPTLNVTGIVPGSYIFEWSISNGICAVSADSVTVSVDDLPVNVNAGNDQEWCNLSSITMQATPVSAGTGQWTQLSGPSGGTIVDATDPVTNINNLSPGVYEFGWAITNGVCTTEMDTMKLIIYALPDIALAGNDQSLCDVNTTTLNATTVINGLGAWSLLTGPNVPNISNVNDPSTALNGLVEGDYYFLWTITNGLCSSADDTVIVSIANLPSVAVCGNDQLICNSNMITINADLPSSGVGMWTQTFGPSSGLIASDGSPVTLVSNIIPGTYVFQWTVSNGTCPVTQDTIQVTVSESASIPAAGLDQVLCNADQAELTALTPLSGTGLWSVFSGNATIASPSTAITTVENLSPGIYTFRWTVTNSACVAYDDVQLTVHPAPVVSVDNHLLTTCNGAPVTLIANGADTYHWSPSTALSDTGIYNPVATPRANIVYYVTGTDVNGCSSTDSLTVEVCSKFFIPNGFSPDGDGVNDEFVIDGLDEYPGNILRIFNRWGNLIYEKEHYDNTWNGYVNVGSLRLGNGKVPSGTYYYILELGAGEKARTGYIIVRY